MEKSIKNYEDIKELNEDQVLNLFSSKKISRHTFDEYYLKTSVHQRGLRGNSVWNQLR